MRYKQICGTFVAFTILICTGCSTYEGMKLGIKKDAAGNDVPVPPTGIPYLLVRPEYTLKSTSSVVSEYTLAVTYDVDPGQMYSIKMSPGPFVDGGFVIKLAAKGNITSTSATITDQVGPMITALGSFAKDMAGVVSRDVFEKNNIRQLLIGEMSAHNECKVLSDVPIAPISEPDGSPPPVKRTVGEEIGSRLLLLQNDDDITNKFHYLTIAERNCLLASLQISMQTAGLSGGEKKSDFARSLEQIITMSDAVWLARQVLFLEQQITRVELARVRQPAMTAASERKIADYIRTLQLVRARTLGVTEVYERSLALTDFIKPGKREGGHVLAASEYVAVRLELDEIFEQIDARRVKVQAEGKPTTAPTPVVAKNEPIKRVKQVDIDASKIEGWASGPGKDADRYVFVLKEMK